MMLNSAFALATLLTIAVAAPALKVTKANVTQDVGPSQLPSPVCCLTESVPV